MDERRRQRVRRSGEVGGFGDTGLETDSRTDAQSVQKAGLSVCLPPQDAQQTM